MFSENQVDLSILGDVEDAEIEVGLRTNRSTPRPRLDLLGHPLGVDTFAGDAVFDDAIRKFPVRYAVKVGSHATIIERKLMKNFILGIALVSISQLTAVHYPRLLMMV